MGDRELSAADRAAAVNAEIERILSLSPGEVRVLWRKWFRKDVPRALTTQLLVRMLVWKVQEEVFGDYDAATLKLLKAFASQDTDKVVLFRKLKSGTVLVREYQGVRHTVTIGQDGFVWQERAYPNLSVIARAITGTNWNGPRFFGLRDPGNGRPVRKAS
jgi:hypothetical protein